MSLIKYLLLIFIPLIISCQSLFFYPQSGLTYDPSQVKYQVKDYFIETEDNNILHAWRVVSKADKRKGVILFFHGNARNISTESLQIFWLSRYGYDIFVADYRGYGASTGSSSIDTIISDSLDIMDGFMELYGDEENIIVWGQSLGGQAAAAVAANSIFADKISLLVLDSTFATWRSIGKEVASKHVLTYIFQYAVAGSLPDNNSAYDFVANSKANRNILIHSRADRFIGYNNSIQLYKNMVGDNDIYLFDNNSHARILSDIKNRGAILDILDSSIINSDNLSE